MPGGGGGGGSKPGGGGKFAISKEMVGVGLEKTSPATAVGCVGRVNNDAHSEYV